MSAHSIVKLSDLAGGVRIDPEYYQPRYLADASRLAALDCADLGSIAFVTDGIHASPDEVDVDGVTYLSAKCVKSNDFVLGRAISISKKQHEANPRTCLRPDDVLLTTVGTIGNAAVVQPDFLPANSDRHLGIIRVAKEGGFDPYYIAAFLNSEFGRFQTLREATGNVQLNLFIEKIKKLRIPRLECADEVARLVRLSYKQRVKAASSVRSAESAVVEALNLKSVDTRPSLTYVSALSELVSGKRFGAEFYMPAKGRVLQALSAGGSEPLSRYVVNVREMWNPALATGTVRSFDLSDAMEPFLDDRGELTSVDTIRSTKKRLRTGDVVISRLRSYLKQIAVVRCADAEEVVGSSEFIVLRPSGKLPAETLLAFLRSDPVQTVLRWSQDGTNHPRFDEETLLSLPVPAAISSGSVEIAQSVRGAIQARQEMASLLKKADRLINEEIMSVRL